MIKTKIKILFFLLLPGFLFAQVSGDSLSFLSSNYTNKVLSTNLEKQLNTTNLNSLLRYNYSGNNFFFGVTEQYKSTVIKLRSKNIRDEQNFSLFGEYSLLPSVKIGILTNNNIYSDDRKIGINEASLLNSSLYAKFNISGNLRLTPYGGFSINKQVGEDDRGAIYGTEALLNYVSEDDFSLDANLKLQNEDISPRKNTLRFINASLSNKVGNNFSNLVTAKYSEVRKDFYFDSDSLLLSTFNINHNIQSRSEKSYLLADRIFLAPVSENISLNLNGKVYWREIDRNTRYFLLSNISPSTFDSKIEEFKLNFDGNLIYRSKKLNGMLKIEYSEREEKHKAKNIKDANNIFFEKRQELENSKNNKSQLTVLATSWIYSFSEKDKINFSLLHRKLIYDTPSEANFDDRDELLTIFRLKYMRKLNPVFSWFVNLEGSINHIVYIFAERSSNNNIRRVLKLSSGGSFNNKFISSENIFEVSANYTVYDFEDIIPNVKSFVFRQFAFRDSSKINLLPDIFLSLEGYIKLSEQGNFRWTSFSSKPERFLAEYFALPQIIVRKNNLEFGAGIRLFSLTTFKYNSDNIKYKSSNYFSFGPVTQMGYKIIDNLNVAVYGWYEFITTESSDKKEIANLSMKVDWKL